MTWIPGLLLLVVAAGLFILSAGMMRTEDPAKRRTAITARAFAMAAALASIIILVIPFLI